MIERFRTYLISEKRYSPLTVRNYIGDLYDFVELKNIAPDEFNPKNITRDDIREWIIALGEYRNSRGQTLSAASINRRMSSIKSFFGWLVRKGLVEKDPTICIHRLKTASRLPSFISEEEIGIRQIDEIAQNGNTDNDFLATRNKLIISLLYGLGLRRAELIGINLDDFSSDKSRLRIRGKGGKERTLPVMRYIIEQIDDYLNIASSFFGQNICIKDKKALILSLKGERISANSVYKIVKQELAKMGIKGKLSPHILRHTFATHLMNHGGDMRAIQELMGHASLRSTQVYTHNTISTLQRAYNRAHPRGAKQQLSNHTKQANGAGNKE